MLRTRSTLLATALVGLVTAGAFAASHHDAGAPATRTVYGRAVALGAGTARAYLVLAGGKPVEIGVALNEASFTGLPANDSTAHGGITMPDGHTMFEHVLALPADNPTPFRHVVLNWNPGGHEPPGIYDTPHFDFHFYTITEAERAAVVPGPDFERLAAKHPSPDEMPAGYMATPPVPTMGVHWLDPKTPELNGGRFVQTFIAGSWDGRPTFLEPMVTKAFLESRPDFHAAIPPVKRRAAAGWYPRGYAIRWDAQAKEYRVSLRDFAYESAS